MTTIQIISWRMDDRLLEDGSYDSLSIEERSKQVDGIYLLYLDPLYPYCNQPVISLTTVRPLLSQPTGRSKDPPQYWYCCIVFFIMMIMTPYAYESMFYVKIFFVTITSYHTFLLWLWWFCLLSAPLWFHCLHTLYCYLFLAIGLCADPAFHCLVYNQDRMYRLFL